MNIILYNNSSDDNVVSKNILAIKSVSATGFNASSVMNPEILLAYDSAIFSANYMYIDTYARYYYITDITVIDGHRVKVTGRVDVLMSFDVKSIECIAGRQSGAFNLYIPDPKITRVAYDRVQLKTFPNTPFTSNRTIILAVAGS